MAPISTDNKDEADKSNRQAEIQGLLQRLTDWQRSSGMVPSGSLDVASTGESTAAIADLKGKLGRLGARYKWSPGADAYEQLESSAEANRQKDYTP